MIFKWGVNHLIHTFKNRKKQFFFRNTSFPYSKSYSIDRKHISDTPRHSRRVQNTILISKTYFQDEKYDFFLLKLQGKMTNFFRRFFFLYRFPSVLHRALYKTIEEFFSKIRRFLTSNCIMMFENTSPTLLDTRDVFRIRFWYQKRILGMKMVFLRF